MPFTFSHPAAVLPFSYLPKRYVSFSGLMVGSMVPDLEYFFRFRAQSHYSHTWAGVFWFDLPLALLCCFLFHNLVRDILITNLPSPIAARCVHCYRFNWNAWFRHKWPVIIACILIGTASHLIWDGLTHETTNTLQQSDYIQNKNIPAKGIVVYYTYWGLNSAAGMALLLIGFWKMPVRKKLLLPSSQRIYWWLILIISTAVLTIRLFIGRNLVFVDVVDSAISSSLIALLAASLIVKPLYRTVS